jgi:hypothetical protein
VEGGWFDLGGVGKFGGDGGADFEEGVVAG